MLIVVGFEHLGGHSSWREPTMIKFRKESNTYFVRGVVCIWNIEKMQSESHEYVRKKNVFFERLEESKLHCRATLASTGRKRGKYIG